MYSQSQLTVHKDKLIWVVCNTNDLLKLNSLVDANIVSFIKQSSN